MTNSDNGDMLVDEILRGAYKEYPGVFTSKQKIPVELDAKILNKCTGEFTIPKFDFMTVELSVDQGHLFFTYPYPEPKSEKIKIELTPESATAFFNIEKGVEIKFSDDYSVLNLFGTKATRVSMSNTLLSQSGKYKITDDLPSETIVTKDDRPIKDDSDIVGLNII